MSAGALSGLWCPKEAQDDVSKSRQLAGDVRAHHGDTRVCGRQALSDCSVGPRSREALIWCGGEWRARGSMSVDLWGHVQSCCPQAGSAGLSRPHVTTTLLALFAEESPPTFCWHPKHVVLQGCPAWKVQHGHHPAQSQPVPGVLQSWEWGVLGQG